MTQASKEQPAGVLCIDKPAGITSHDVVAAVRRLARMKRVGHAGTLDPLATGVLLVCLGRATRISDYLQAGEKHYRTVMRLGAATTTYDAEGEITDTAELPPLSAANIAAVLQDFVGEIEQVPPMYSAIKQGGVPLHKLARAGKEVVRPARKITIHEIVLEAWEPPHATLRVRCGSGTYIRSLVHDVGIKLGTFAHVRRLRRLASGDWRVEDAVPLATLQEAGADWQRFLTPLSQINLGLPRLQLDAGQALDFCYGKIIRLDQELWPAEYQVFGPDNLCLGIGRMQSAKQLHPYKVFLDPTSLASA